MICSGLTAHLIRVQTIFRLCSQHFTVKLWLPQMLPNFGYGCQIMPTDVKKQGLPQMSANRPSMDSFKAFCFQDAFDMIPWSSGGEVRVTTHLQSFALPGYYRDKEDALLSHLKLSEATAKWLSHMNLPSAGFALGSCSCMFVYIYNACFCILVICIPWR